jgi:V/A-type H+-transporting ATPase subunit C
VTGGVAAYAATNARVRAMYSHLLSAQQLAILSEAEDFASLLSSLRRTIYGSYLESLKEKDVTPRSVVFQIKLRLAAAYQSVIHSTPEPARGVLTQLYRYYEVNNIKAVLRGIAIGGAGTDARPVWEHVRDVLFPFGSTTVVPAEAMVETGNVGAAIELLRGTPYYDVLSFALKRYSAEQSLFPLEVALDLGYWRRLWEAARKLLGQDQGPALRVVGALLDTNNLMWAIRYRVYQRLSEEELINYTLPFGYRVRDEDIRALAAGADMASIVMRLYPGIPDVNALLDDPQKGLPTLETGLKRYVMQQCMATFLGNPFHIGIPLAYLVLSDLETQDLTVLIEAKSMRMPSSDFRPFLVAPLAMRG